jgi:hypothetical protein
MAWFLAPALEDLRAEFNYLNPDRDKTSDGTIGDAAHSQTTSKHNPNSLGVVRAFDCDMTGPWPGVTFGRLVQHVVSRHRAGSDNRLQNVIWDGQIASRSWGWTWRDYDGANPHDKHAHFEVRDAAAYWNDRGPFGLKEEFGMALIDDIVDGLMARKAELASATASKLGVDLTNPNSTVYKGTRDAGRDGARDLLWDAVHAKRTEVIDTDGTISYELGRDAEYDEASTERRTEMRNALQLLQELGIAVKGSPTPEG